MVRSQRGDTIIEVLFAMAIIGIVLAAAYGIASKNLQTSQFAKERTQATLLAESQIEQIQALSKAPPAGIGAFCVDVTHEDNYLLSAFNVDGSENEECVNGFFGTSVTRDDNIYTVVVSWIPPGGSEDNPANVTMHYRYNHGD